MEENESVSEWVSGSGVVRSARECFGFGVTSFGFRYLRHQRIRRSTTQYAERTQRERDSGHRPPLQQNPKQERSNLIEVNLT
jgi:hypothetical protein